MLAWYFHPWKRWILLITAFRIETSLLHHYFNRPLYILKREAPDGSLTKQTGRDERISTIKPRNRAEKPSSERQASAKENQKSVDSSVCSSCSFEFSSRMSVERSQCLRKQNPRLVQNRKKRLTGKWLFNQYTSAYCHPITFSTPSPVLPLQYVFSMCNMRVTPRHRYCHSNTRLHRPGKGQPTPFPFVWVVLFFNQSIFLLMITVVLIGPYAY